LIADRNRHVREYIRREMMAEGYDILLAASGQEVLKRVYKPEPPDLLILDPDLSDSEGLPLLEKIEDRIPSLPVVIHGFSSDYRNGLGCSSVVAFVEKEANSIDRLKILVARLLQPAAPNESP
jgi:DNA-binding NtrC family response regulator